MIKSSRSIPNYQTKSQRDTWKRILEIPDANDSKLNMQIGKVIALPEEIHLWLREKFPGKNWVDWKVAFDKAFSNTNLKGQWAEIDNPITD